MSNIKQSIWIFTFEYEGVVKVGGLGEVPANQVKSLSDKFNFTIFLPSHGKSKELKEKWPHEKLSLTCSGEINPNGLGLSDRETHYEIGVIQFHSDHGKIILIKGENTLAKKYLEDPSPYNPETFKGKLALYTFGVNCYFRYILENKDKQLPKLIHLHDYHVIIPYISMKQILYKRTINIPSLITFHLLTWPRYELQFLKACGIDETPIKVRMPSSIKEMNIHQIYDIFRKEDKSKPPSMEQIGAIISDMIITVSESYLKSDIIPNLGDNLIKFKSDFVWNGCDWDYDTFYADVNKRLGVEIRDVLGLSADTNIQREDLKKYLLTYKLGHLSSPPGINSPKILNHINELSQGQVFKEDGLIKSFDSSGPLAIATGRLSPQKGLDLILEGIPEAIHDVPNSKFLLLILPTEYSLDQITECFKYIREYKENLRIVFGKAFDIFHLAHLSADVYCALSRWEPFGITALEAMASKIPLIATRVGGLQETVVDIRRDPKEGTGLLIEKENVSSFSKGIISLFKSAKIADNINQNGQADSKLIREIPDEKIRNIVKQNPSYYEVMRNNCYKRVENHFRWNLVSRKLEQIYKDAIFLFNSA